VSEKRRGPFFGLKKKKKKKLSEGDWRVGEKRSAKRRKLREEKRRRGIVPAESVERISRWWGGEKRQNVRGV